MKRFICRFLLVSFAGAAPFLVAVALSALCPRRTCSAVSSGGAVGGALAAARAGGSGRKPAARTGGYPDGRLWGSLEMGSALAVAETNGQLAVQELFVSQDFSKCSFILTTHRETPNGKTLDIYSDQAGCRVDFVWAVRDGGSLTLGVMDR